MNKLGMFLRKLRIEHQEVLFDMAQRLGISSAFLSAVENDRKAAPISWIDTISTAYGLDTTNRNELTRLICESIKQVRMDIGNVSEEKRDCALAFARSFDDFTENDISELMAVLEKRGNK